MHLARQYSNKFVAHLKGSELDATELVCYSPEKIFCINYDTTETSLLLTWNDVLQNRTWTSSLLTWEEVLHLVRQNSNKFVTGANKYGKVFDMRIIIRLISESCKVNTITIRILQKCSFNYGMFQVLPSINNYGTICTCNCLSWIRTLWL